MLDKEIYRQYTGILEHELIEATGCTEPIALALTGAIARKYLPEAVQSAEVYCSGNIIKNVKGVTVPNSGNLKGIEAAVLIGMIAGDPEANLQVIADVTDEQRRKLKEELKKDYVQVFLAEDVPSLYIRVRLKGSEHSSEVILQGEHTDITTIKADDQVILDSKVKDNLSKMQFDKSLLNVRDILEYAETVDLETIRPILERQVRDNEAISNEGLKNCYGAQVGRTLMRYGQDVATRARAKAAAGSDARMNGCPMPVVINSGSGNQGITVSMPVLEYAREYQVGEEKLYRALAISNLISIHQKQYIGPLSAYCGAVSAAGGAGCGIGWLLGYSYQQIVDVLTNTIASIGGMVCDGAKSSCAGKISLAVEAALQGLKMAKTGNTYLAGEGLVKEESEDTIRAFGQMAKEGMRGTDEEILKLMLQKRC